MGSTPVMLAAENGHKDVVSILAQKGANLDIIDNVSFHVHTLSENSCITDDKNNVTPFPKDCHYFFFYYNYDKC